MQIATLEDLSKGLSEIEASSTSYTFNTINNGEIAYLSSLIDGTVVINNYGTLGNRAHEVTHAIQHERGFFTFKSLGGNDVEFKKGASVISLEIPAYRSEYSITNGTVPTSDASMPKSILDLNPEWVKGIRNPLTGKYIYK